MDKRIPKILKNLAFCGIAAFSSIGVNAQSYCTASGGCSSDYIGSVSTTGGSNNISNSTGCASGGYTYYVGMKHTGVAGLNFGYNVTMGSLSEYIGIYIDFNNNGLFTDAGETVYSTTTSTRVISASGTFTIPSGATPGITRMRVVCDWSTYPPNPCGSRTWGEIEDYDFEILSPCTAINTVSNSTPGSKSVTVNWTPVTGSAGYEYVVSTSTTNPTAAGTPISSTSVNITGLNPATNYCVFVRNKCNATAFSQWKSTCFTTSNCSAPAISFANITHNSALALWNSNPIAVKYEYIYTTDATTPGASATGTTTTQNSFQMNGLTPETTYYVHVRTHCTGNEKSTWDTYQFNTMKECVPPVVDLIKASITDMEATWQPVSTAVAYEYAITTTQIPPSLGKNVYDNKVSINIPNDKKAYYFHIRSNCISIFNASEWSTALLREADATAINTINEGSLLVQAYPNPVKDVITIQVDGMKQATGTVIITDVAGKTISNTNITEAKTNISMHNIAAGVYFIKYTNGTYYQSFRINKL